MYETWFENESYILCIVILDVLFMFHAMSSYFDCVKVYY